MDRGAVVASGTPRDRRAQPRAAVGSGGEGLTSPRSARHAIQASVESVAPRASPQTTGAASVSMREFSWPARLSRSGDSRRAPGEGEVIDAPAGEIPPPPGVELTRDAGADAAQ